MSITKTTFKASFGGKKDNVDAWTGELWDNTLNAMDSKFGEIIDAINGGTGGVSAPVSGKFYVNGQEKTATGGKIELPCFGQEGYPSGGYVFSGTLNAQVLIGKSTDAPTDDTIVVLDGVSITTSATDNVGIGYLPDAQTMRVTLAANKVNTITCSHVAARADSQKACLYAEKNMIVQGNGYLVLRNEGGHGIKSSELKLTGRPHISASCIHDAIHGNSLLTIDEGKYYIVRANDAFGTRAKTEEKTGGTINVFGGEIWAYNLEGYVFSNKGDGVSGAKGVFYTDNYAVHTDVAPDKVAINMVRYASDSTALATALGTGSVRYYASGSDAKADNDGTGGTEITIAESGTYAGCYVVGAHDKVRIHGYVDKPIVFDNKATDGINVYMGGAAVVVKDSDFPALLYTPGSKKLEIESMAGTVNIIMQCKDTETAGKDYDAVKSENNLKMEIKSGSHLIVSSVLGDGLDASDVTIQTGAGTLIASGCGERGIKSTTCYIACRDNNGSVVTVDSSDTQQYVKGAILAFDNCRKYGKPSRASIYGGSTVGMADIYIRNSKLSKGTMNIKHDHLIGVLSCGSIASVACINNLLTVNEVSRRVFYNQLVAGTFINDPGETVEDKNYIAIG